MPFTPNESEQRLPLTYYRGCWHVISRGCRMVPSSQGLLDLNYSSHLSEVYNPRAFILHAASLRQGFPHCARFLTAASRRSLARVSVPVWPIILSDRLSVKALVGHYPTNKLIDRRTIQKRMKSSFTVSGLWGISHSFPWLSPTSGQVPTCYSPVRHSCTPKGLTVRLACLRRAASVRSEPGSNSPL